MIGIFIPTYNRSEFLKRAFTYYNNKSDLLTNVNFYVYDASDELFYIKNLSILSNYKNLNIVHKRYTNTKNEYQRFFDSSIDISDEYILQVGDDDFIIAESLKAAQIFLDNNSDYIACSGMRTSFVIIDSDENNVKGLNIQFTRTVPGPYWPLNDPIARFKTYMRTGIPMQHFLVRNHIYKKMYAHLANPKFVTSLLSQDLLPCAILAISGNIKRLDYILSYARQESDSSTYKYLNNLMEENDFPQTLKEVKNELYNNFLKFSYSSEEIKFMIEKEFIIRFMQLLQWANETKYSEDDSSFSKIQEENQFIPSTKMYYTQIIRDLYEVCKK